MMRFSQRLSRTITVAVVMGAAGATALALSANTFAGSEEIAASAKNADLWPAPGRDLSLTRHSPLNDINTGNVSGLNMIWSQSTGTLRGHEGQPIVVTVDGKPMMYFVSAWPNIVQALDLTDADNPKQVWNYVKKSDRDDSAVPRACCDVVNRGLNYADGKIIFHTLDGFVIALDAKSGKLIWSVKHAYPEHGETITGPTLIAGDLVVAGFGGDEFAARGRLSAYRIKDGSKVWECQSNGTDKEICMTPDTNKKHPEFGAYGHDISLHSYPGDEWKRGGGSPWAWGSYDPELKMIFWSTGNPGNWSPTTRCDSDTHEKCNDGHQDNKFSMTIFARKAETGEVVWAYQMTPFDQWDYDGVNENVLVTMKVDGADHKVLVHFDRNGFAYVIDRTDGTLLRANKFVTVNWAEKVDLKTGRPIKVKEHSPFNIHVNTQACPSAMGGKDQQPVAVDPADPTKFYVPTNNWCMEDEPQARTHTQQGTVYVFANVYMYPEKPGITGKFKKFDVLTGKSDWEIPDPYPNWGGALVTDGGLAFYGSLGGDFRAVDRNTGKVVWHRKLGSGIIGNPIAWKSGGHEYISVFCGIGGWIGLPAVAGVGSSPNYAYGLDADDKYGAIGATAMAKASGLFNIPSGGMLYTFRVM
jgi:PQQ-dependent dehydrogenase (methanol/ethanol family)